MLTLNAYNDGEPLDVGGDPAQRIEDAGRVVRARLAETGAMEKGVPDKWGDDGGDDNFHFEGDDGVVDSDDSVVGGDGGEDTESF